MTLCALRLNRTFMELKLLNSVISFNINLS